MGSIPGTTELGPGRALAIPVLPQTKERSKNSRAAFLLLSFAVPALSVLFVLNFYLGIYRSTLNALMIVILALTIVVIILKDSEMRANPFHPLAVVLTLTFLGYPFRAVMLEAFRLNVIYSASPLRHMAEGCFIITFYVVLFYWGYRSWIGLSLAQQVPLLVFSGHDKNPGRLVVRSYILFGVGLLARAVAMGNGVSHFQAPLQSSFLKYASFVGDLDLFSIYALMGVVGLAMAGRISPLWVAPLLVGEVAASSPSVSDSVSFKFWYAASCCIRIIVGAFAGVMCWPE